VSLKRVTKERAERIAKAHACENCGEYSYKKVSVRAATRSEQQEVGIAWLAQKVCGVCNAHHEMGLNEEGDIVYVS